MKIEHEIQNVRVVRYDTIGNALIAVYGKYHLDWVKGAVEGSFRVENQPHAQVLHKALRKQYDASEDNIYARDCALAMLDQPWKVGDFLRTVDSKGYYAASMSESTAYLRSLKENRVKFADIIHLGTFIMSDEDYREKRLLVRANGSAELITIYSSESVLKAAYQVVLSRKPPKVTAPPKPKSLFGRLVA